MLIIGQPDKIHRDLRNIKGSTDLSATSMWILVSHNNQYVSILVFLTLYVVVLGLHKIQQGHCFMLPLFTLLPDTTTT